METKCMNPIIYIDELDKISKTEHGKEIVGILTHLTDTTIKILLVSINIFQVLNLIYHAFCLYFHIMIPR